MTKDYVSEIKYTKYILDKDSKIIKCDDMFEEITGYTKEDVARGELSQQSLLVDEDVEYYLQVVAEELSKSREAYLEHRIKRKDGSIIFVFCIGILDVDKDTGEEISIIRVTDMSTTNTLQLQKKKIIKEASQAMADLQEQLVTDELTGLLRRGPFIQEVTKQIEAKRNFTFIMVDIDNFKDVNDDYGHSVGDDVLKQVSGAFKVALRAHDVICRMGGDEFAILLTNFSDEERVVEIIARINNRINNMPVVLEKGVKVTLSLGIKLCRDFTGVSFVQLYTEADEALYKAKKNGKNGYVIVQ